MERKTSHLEPLVCHWQDNIRDDICHVSHDMTGHSHKRAVLQDTSLYTWPADFLSIGSLSDVNYHMGLLEGKVAIKTRIEEAQGDCAAKEAHSTPVRMQEASASEIYLAMLCDAHFASMQVGD